MRTDQEIVDQTEEIARIILGQAIGTGYVLTEELLVREQHDPRCRSAWGVAKQIQELMTATDVDDALINLEADEEQRLATHPATANFAVF